MRALVPWEDLQVVEDVVAAFAGAGARARARARRQRVGVGVVGRGRGGRGQVEELEEGDGNVRGGGAGGGGEEERGRGAGFGGEQDGGDVCVEAEAFAPSVCVQCQFLARMVRSKAWMRGKTEVDLPVHGLGVSVFGFQGRRDVRVDPERPEGVVQIKYQHFG